MSKTENERGQLTLGFAIAFTMVLAIFGLVLRSGLIVREKMKLQQTSDLAALVAANVQRNHLNLIHDINEAIEHEFNTTQIALTAMGPACLETVFPLTLGGEYSSVLAYTAPFSFLHTRGDENDHPINECDRGCNGYDSSIRNTLIDIYNYRRSQYAAAAIKVIQETNSLAYEKTLDTFLTPQNLPFGLGILLRTKLGSGLTRDIIKAAYDRGDLKDQLRVVDSFKDLPLFNPKNENRAFLYQRYHYRKSFRPGPSAPIPICTLTPRPDPRPAFTAVKIARDGDFNTSFLTGAEYGPPNDDAYKWGIKIKNSTSDSFGKELKDVHGKSIDLLRERAKMAAFALAKPYGGTFPKAGNVLNPFDHGDVGRTFEGAKLIGIADRDQIGIDLPLEGELAGQDVSGREREHSKFYKEDFLH